MIYVDLYTRYLKHDGDVLLKETVFLLHFVCFCGQLGPQSEKHVFEGDGHELLHSKI